MCVVGGRVLDAIGIERVVVPEGGVVERDAAGRPTGLLQEQAQALVRALVYPYPQAELVEAIGRASEHYLREGLTSVQEAGVGGGLVARSPVELSAWQEARRQGRLGVRATLMVAAEALHDLPHAAADGDGFGLDLGIRTGWGDEWLRIGAVKVFSDGSLIGRTAAMCCDFEGEAGNRGFFQMDVERLRRIITRAHRAGWQVATHAIGDRAIATVLDIYQDALAAHPRPDHRHRIEHCGVCRPEDVRRLAALGVIPVPQGRFISEIGDGMLAALGPERSTWCYRQRSFLDAGLLAARQLGPSRGEWRPAAGDPRHGQPADGERAALQPRRSGLHGGGGHPLLHAPLRPRRLPGGRPRLPRTGQARGLRGALSENPTTIGAGGHRRHRGDGHGGRRQGRPRSHGTGLIRHGPGPVRRAARRATTRTAFSVPCPRCPRPRRATAARGSESFSYIPTRVRNVGPRRLTASLVRGQDHHGHFDPEPRPRGDFDAEARAAHGEACARFFGSHGSVRTEVAEA